MGTPKKVPLILGIPMSLSPKGTTVLDSAHLHVGIMKCPTSWVLGGSRGPAMWSYNPYKADSNLGSKLP